MLCRHLACVAYHRQPPQSVVNFPEPDFGHQAGGTGVNPFSFTEFSGHFPPFDLILVALSCSLWRSQIFKHTQIHTESTPHIRPLARTHAVPPAAAANNFTFTCRHANCRSFGPALGQSEICPETGRRSLDRSFHFQRKERHNLSAAAIEMKWKRQN